MLATAVTTTEENRSLLGLTDKQTVVRVIQRSQKEGNDGHHDRSVGVVRQTIRTNAIDQIQNRSNRDVENRFQSKTRNSRLFLCRLGHTRVLRAQSGGKSRRRRTTHLCLDNTRYFTLRMFEDCKVELLETFGDDLTVVNAARVSLGKHVTEFTERDAKLVKYLVDHDHTSPFFHPQARFRLKMPIWMAREWFRHTVGFARNEVSRRYVDTPPTFHIPEHLRSRAPNKKQGSQDDIHDLSSTYKRDMELLCDEAMASYMRMLSNGVCPEQARMILPQNMMTEFIETGSLAAYARLCHLRMSPDAQQEIREVAQLVSDELKKVFPVSWAALIAETPSP